MTNPVLSAMFLVMIAGWGNFAQAAIITYTFSGVADGNLNGVPFSDVQFTFTAKGNTDTVIGDGESILDNPITSLEFDIQGIGSGAMLGEYMMFSNFTTQSVGIWFLRTGGDRMDVFDTGLANYDLRTSTGPFSGDLGIFVGQFINDPTTAGPLNMFHPTSLTFSAVATAVPEPASLATIGSGVVGLAVGWWRRRGKQKSA